MTAAAVPSECEVAFRRAVTLHQNGRSSEAVGELVAAIRLDPQALGPYRMLADVQRLLGHRNAEAAVLEVLSIRDPLDAKTWTRLADLQAAAGSQEGAYLHYRQAGRLDTTDIQCWQGLCLTALATQRFTEAQAALATLRKHFPTSPSTHVCAGHIHKAAGEYPEANAAYRQALALVPTWGEALYNLVDVGVPKPHEPLALQVTQALARHAATGPDRANLHFAKARILEAAGEYEPAFEQYQCANETMTRLTQEQGGSIYRPEDAEAWVNAIAGRYPATPSGPTLGVLPIEVTPVFIIGMPRSGTSLVEQILVSHPLCAGGGELGIAAECERHFLAQRKIRGFYGAIDVSAEHDLLLDARERFVDKLFEHNLDQIFVTDKTPGNFSRVAFLQILFPDARFVHCRRSPIATCWSLYTSNFAQHEAYYNSLVHLAHFYGCYRRLMDHWTQCHAGLTHEIQYESLLIDPRNEVHRLLRYVGLDWHEDCLKFDLTPRPVLTASHSDVRRPFYRDSIAKWRRFEKWLDALKSMPT